MAFFKIEGNGIAFEVEIEGKPAALVQMDGGQWDYQRLPNGGHEWLGGGRLSFAEILKRAYERAAKAGG
jgi:hypothetical protein